MTDEQIIRAFLAGVAPHKLIQDELCDRCIKDGKLIKNEVTVQELAQASVSWADELLGLITRDTVASPPPSGTPPDPAEAFAAGVVNLFRADEVGPPDYEELLKHIAELRDEVAASTAERFANIRQEHR